MPTPDEKRRPIDQAFDRLYGPSSVQARPPASPAVGSRWGGVWDSVRKEWNAMAAGNPEGRAVYEQGRDAITGTIGNAFRGAAEIPLPSSPGRLSFTGDVADLGRKAAGLFPQGPGTDPQVERLRTREAMIGPQEPNFDTRARRLQQAGVAPAAPTAAAAPVMANDAGAPVREEIGLRGENLPPQEGGRGNVAMQPPLSESAGTTATGKAKVAAGPGAFRGGIGAPMQLAESDRAYMQPNPQDPRQRYYDMANMSLEQREAFLNSLPEGQRPIQTIRGNKEGWYNPALSKEFATIPEAMSGIEGRPTYLTEEKRREEALDRGAMLERQRYASDMAYRARIDAEAMQQAGENSRATIKGATGKNGKPTEEWKFEKSPNADGSESGVLVEKHSGRVLPVKINEAHNLGAIFKNSKPDQWGVNAQFLSGFDRETRNEVFKYLSPEMQEYMIGYFETMAAKGKKKE